MKARAHVFINGTVQGVFFRYKTAEEAERLSLDGWVKNLKDGRVEAIFEGERENVEDAIRYCQRGPTRARVTDVKVIWEEYSGRFRGFNVTY
ncbi:MAG: acylphosphatase [Candidatus Bathyarchaeota archaeon]